MVPPSRSQATTAALPTVVRLAAATAPLRGALSDPAAGHPAPTTPAGRAIHPRHAAIRRAPAARHRAAPACPTGADPRPGNRLVVSRSRSTVLPVHTGRAAPRGPAPSARGHPLRGATRARRRARAQARPGMTRDRSRGMAARDATPRSRGRRTTTTPGTTRAGRTDQRAAGQAPTATPPGIAPTRRARDPSGGRRANGPAQWRRDRGQGRDLSPVRGPAPWCTARGLPSRPRRRSVTARR
jgi:hypothetical protein